jgi:hypothetical protein
VTHVLIGEVEATIVGHEAADLLAVLDQLHAHALADGRVRLLGLKAQLLNHDALGVRRNAHGEVLERCAERDLLVLEVGPFLVLTVQAQLATGLDSTRLAVKSCVCVVFEGE